MGVRPENEAKSVEECGVPAGGEHRLSGKHPSRGLEWPSALLCGGTSILIVAAPVDKKGKSIKNTHIELAPPSYNYSAIKRRARVHSVLATRSSLSTGAALLSRVTCVTVYRYSHAV
jgi:hypothetical protein